MRVADVAAKVPNAIVGGPFGSNLVSRDYVASGVPVIRGQNMGQRWLRGVFAFVTSEKAQSLAANIARPLDVVVTQRGTLGQVSLVPDAPYAEYVVSQSQMKITVDRSKAEPMFIYYALNTPEQKDYVERTAIRAGVPHTNLQLLRETPIALPSLPEQREIAALLGALDDKIELNRRMTVTLEKLARTKFRQATAAGTQGSLADVATLNPESWSKLTRPSIIEYVDLSNTKWGHIESTARHDGETAPSRAQRVLRPGDTIVGTVRPGNGSFALVDRDGLTGSTGFAVLRPKEAFFTEFVYLAATARERIDELALVADGAAYPAVRPDVVLDTPVRLPGRAEIEQFSRVARPLFERIAVAESESRTLAALRDTLLPKLISGELRVAPEGSR